MSRCTNCNGSGTVTCSTCHGQGFTTRFNDDGEETKRLCGACEGKRQVRCMTCHGTGDVVVRPGASPAPAMAATATTTSTSAAHPGAPIDRLAGRWNGVQGTWYEFVPDGNRYRATSGGPMGASGTGTATLVGHKVSLDASDKLLGHYTLELNLHGNFMDGIDRKAGFPIPVTFRRAAAPGPAAPGPAAGGAAVSPG